ncbi:MAG: hypothetical protein JXA73_10660 [Acidobacteria bacterium]|nr:hypothetical protein [Acidobacteriota bacterium]
MADSQSIVHPRLWINYPYIDKEERDFSYLVPQLKNDNIEAVYDSFRMMSDTHLWARVVPRLISIGFDGWLYILTHQCFTRKTYTDELTGAIDQVVKYMGPEFPMIGLMHGIATQNVPPALRVRPCISLGDPEWKRQLSAVFKNRVLLGKDGKMRKDTCYEWRIHSCYGGDPSMTAIEVRSTDERIQYWRFAIPKSVETAGWGQGPSGGADISRVRFAEAKGTGRHEGRDITWFGAANTISDTESAYAVFLGPLPEFICFGPAKSPFGPPGVMEVIRPNLLSKPNQIH